MAVTIYSSMGNLPKADAEKLSYACRRSLFASLEWFSCLLQYGQPADTVTRIYVACDDQRPQDKCYLFLSRAAGKRELKNLSNFYTMEFEPIFSSPHCDKAKLLQELAESLSAERPAWWRLNVQLVCEGTENTTLLCAALAAAGFAINTYFQYENYYIATNGISFDDYYASRPSNVRNTIKRKEKKLAQAHQYTMRIFTTYDDQAVADYSAVYDRSWKNSELYPDFILALCRTAASLGILRMGVLYVDNQPVAAQLWLLSGYKAIIYKLAYDEAYKAFSVGSILTREMIKFVLENEQVTEIDYGVGSESYKKDWMNEKRHIIGIEAFNKRTLVGICLALKNRLGRAVKKVIHTGPKEV